ncbi:hypothetical protein N0V82_008257 [Gnomoniopsis sp. IMI 355080]|nr:hypothetical protein N0V82_008257 [Gnomoniopsis sp. IMI 355080]
MLYSVVLPAALISVGIVVTSVGVVSAQGDANNINVPAPVAKNISSGNDLAQAASGPLLLSTPAPGTPVITLAFQAKIDWDLDNNHTIQTDSGTQASWESREGYWYGPGGQSMGVVLRATDNGFVTAGPNGTQFLNLDISYVVHLDDGHFAFVKHTGGAIVRQYQNGVVRVVTDSPKYNWLNLVDFVAPGNFNGTSVMTVDHYFPNTQNLPEGTPPAGTFS